MVKLQHAGKHIHRLASEPLEKLFAEEWDKSGNRGVVGQAHTLDYLLDDRENPYGTPSPASERDHFVAATVVQWLGSPVGQRFLHKVLSDANKSKNSALRYAFEKICDFRFD